MFSWQITEHRKRIVELVSVVFRSAKETGLWHRLKSDTKPGLLLMAVEECHSLLAQIHGHSLSISIGIFTDKINA